MTLVTVDITAGQAPDQLHFSKYFLLGSTGTHALGLTNGGSVLRGAVRYCADLDTAGGIVYGVASNLLRVAYRIGYP